MRKKLKYIAPVMLSMLLLPGSVYAYDGWKENSKGQLIYYENDQPVKDAWRQIDGKWHYFDSKGKDYKNKWLTEDNKKYRFDENGQMFQNEWFGVQGKDTGDGNPVSYTYYAGPDGAVYANGIFEIDGTEYSFKSNGALQINQFITIGSNKKYAGETGAIKKNELFSTTKNVTLKGPVTIGMSPDEIVSEKTTLYYADENGWIIRNRTVTVDGQQYTANKNGVILSEWQKDDLGDYTYYGKDGVQQFGWIKYPIQNTWLSDNGYYNYNNLYGKDMWFYLDPENEGKAARSRASAYGEVVIEGHTYSMNKRGAMWLGWSPSLYKNPSGMTRYRYYSPEATDKFVQGEKVYETCVFTAPPTDVGLGTDKTWYYFDGNGDYIRADKGKIEIKQTPDGGKAAFDEYGRTGAGLGYTMSKSGAVKSVYFADPENGNKLFSGVKEITLPDGRKEWYAFSTTGESITGEKDGYFYYKGRLQTGNGARRISYNRNEKEDEKENTAFVIVDEAGKVLEHAESFTDEIAKGPEVKDLSFYIGDTDK